MWALEVWSEAKVELEKVKQAKKALFNATVLGDKGQNWVWAQLH